MSILERNFKGIWIPKEIWLNTNLSLLEKLFLVEIDSLDNEKGCFASNAYFAKFFCLSKDRASRIINVLTKKGYLQAKITYRGGTKEVESRILNIRRPPYPIPIGKNDYTPSAESPIPYRQKCQHPIGENTEDNNTLLNNTSDSVIGNSAPKEKAFIPPTLAEVEAYCVERKNEVDPKTFFDYYDASNWVDSRGNKIKNWKQKVITWENNAKGAHSNATNIGSNATTPKFKPAPDTVI